MCVCVWGGGGKKSNDAFVWLSLMMIHHIGLLGPKKLPKVRVKDIITNGSAPDSISNIVNNRGETNLRM